MRERFKFRRVNEITGTFVILVACVLVGAALWTGRSQRWFKTNVTLRISLPEDGAAGIRQGSEVYFLGTLVGTVSDVHVDETGRMEAQASIRRDFFRFVRTDSSAVVKKKFGVAGDSFFEITRGEGAPLRKENATIVCTEQLQSALESAIEEIRSEALVVLKKGGAGLDEWTGLGVELGETQQRLDALIERMQAIVAGVEEGKGTAGKLITDVAIADSAQELLVHANEVMAELRVVVAELDGAVKDVRKGTARLPEITDSVADGVGRLPDLVMDTRSSIREMERLIAAMQKHWLVRKYVDKSKPPPIAKPDAGPKETPEP
ncbi:MAG TPA: MlaD family protein [Opitutaceae bacterium]|nr:MlaD family protein [Opitutaceae bacterium]